MTVFEGPCEMCGKCHCLKVIYKDTYYCSFCIRDALAYERWSRSSTVVELKRRALGDGIDVGRRFTV